MGRPGDFAGSPAGNGLPPISLPKGGGAIRGIDEKLSVDQLTGTARLEVPVHTSPARAGFGPSLGIGYSSGQGNGPYGLGWGIALPLITRKTSMGIPRYDDAGDSDVFIMAGGEELVPVREEVDGVWQPVRLNATVGTTSFAVRRYRPRVEAGFSRIERWDDSATGETHWRVTSRDNVTTMFGQTGASRITDPDDPARVFTWLLDLSFDDRGNAIVYEYKPEDAANVPASAHERGRSVSANRYPKRIWYGNRTPYSPGGALPTDWCFEVVFDYGEHAAAIPGSDEAQTWPCRADPFSTYRAGFEVRTFRTCQRILMFHRFPDELGLDCTIVRSTEFGYELSDQDDPGLPGYTMLTSVIERGWIQTSAGAAPQTAALPPLKLAYSPLAIDDTVRTADPDSLEGFIGDFDGSRRRWVDLFGEGLQGILAEDEAAWYYKHNLGSSGAGGEPGPVTFGPLQLLAEKPNLTVPDSELQLTNLNGDGHLCAVNFRSPAAGWFELDADGSWEPWRPLAPVNVDWRDPNLRLVDVDGDGLPDVLITEDEVLTWYQWNAGDGFGEARRVPKPTDDDQGPALVFSDGAGAIFLADMSGDGLSDLVRIRSGETSYWPNLGYGRYGPKIVMDGAPVFENPDLFDERRLRLADIDGSGTTDLVYLGSDTTTIWFNQSGNAWTAGRQLSRLPPVDDIAQTNVFDLLGTGTSAIVWTSPLPDDAAEPLRYIDLTSSVKPYLLTWTDNNLGATTSLTYAPSTRFYLEDRAAGNRWITRLPFPVHVVTRVQTDEAVSRTSLVSVYTYHHGFYDPAEREFRGFARVDELDAESLPSDSGTGQFTGTPVVTGDEFALAPAWTRTWYHTGAFIDRVDIAHELAAEFYAGDLQAPHPADAALPPDLDAEGQREACRALHGRVLRQEIYAQDDSPAAVSPYVTTEHRYGVDQLQPPTGASYGSYHPWELETVACDYERDPTDPRVCHELTLAIDPYGNVTASASVGYPRRNPAISQQGTTLVTYVEADYANEADQTAFYRLGSAVESRRYELTGVAPDGPSGLFDHDALHAAAAAASVIAYETAPAAGTRQRRLLGRTRTLYRSDDLQTVLPLGQMESLGLIDRSYKLVYTAGLLDQLFVSSGKLASVDFVSDLGGPGALVDLDSDGNQWSPSSRTLYAQDPASPDAAFARHHFYLPQGATDPWGNVATVAFDTYDLLVNQTTDAVGNISTAQHNYRTLMPWLATDPNQNRSGVRFDALGMVTASAQMGKLLPDGQDEGDHLDLSTAEASPSDDPTTRLEYDLDAFATWTADPARDPNHPAPAWVDTLTRVTHKDPQARWLETYTYTDGLGRVALTKVQAESGDAPTRDANGNLVRDADEALTFGVTRTRWVGTGRVVYDNKGNPVKAYEPFFDSSPVYDDETDLVDWGVTSVRRYDPLSRLIRIDNPNGTFRTVALSAWGGVSSDENDTVLSSLWYMLRQGGQLGPAEADAAQKAAAHSATPATNDFDPLGRVVRSVADNGPDGRYATVLTLDVDGQVLSTTDARGVIVASSTYCPGRLEIQTASPDSGERWTLFDAAGQHLMGWDSRGHRFRYEYDALRRPTALLVSSAGAAERAAEQVVYGEQAPDAETQNLRGAAYQHRDESGVATTASRDFKGNVLASSRQFLADYITDVDWTAQPALNAETFTQTGTFDALNRPVTSTTPDGSVMMPSYNERNLLASLAVSIRGSAPAAGVLGSVTYNEKGQRAGVGYGNGAISTYTYDRETFRLTSVVTTRPLGASTVQSLAFAYDPVGNVTRTADTAQQTTFFNGQVVTPEADYTYDAVYQLTQSTGREQIGQAGQPQTTWSDDARRLIPLPVDGAAMRSYVEAYDYDSAGNIKSLDHSAANGTWIREYAYDPASNRLTSTTVLGDQEPYTYDAHGNVATMPHLSLMSWDWKDQLAATARQVVTDGVPETTYYRYDAAGQRLLKATENQDGSLVAQRMYLGAHEVYREYSAATGAITLERQTLRIADGTGCVCVIETVTLDASAPMAGVQPSLLLYQLTNLIGTSVLELDANAAVISYEEYYPYGSTSFQSGRSMAEVGLKRYRYTGKERDTESGFYYHGARYFAPWLGRWISADPGGLHDGPDRYSYTRDNPIRLVDSDGRAAGDPPKLGGLWSYGTRLKDRAKLGHLVEQHHPISVETRQLQRGKYYSRKISRKLKIPGVSKTPGERVLLAETGKGYEHTLVRDSQKAIEARVAAGTLRSESELVHETLEAHRQAWQKAGKVLNEKAFGTSVLENQAAVHRSLSDTVAELRRVKVPPGAGTETAKTAGAEALKVAGEEAVKASAQTGLKEGAKLAATKVAKFIPFVGIVVGVGLVAADLRRGEKGEAALDAFEAIPVVGDVVGAGHLGVQIGTAINAFL